MHHETETNEKAVLKAMQSGAYRDRYLVYNRKSTDEPNNQKNSIQYQKSENIRFSQRFHLPIAQVILTGFAVNGIISEKHSGFKEDAALSFGKDGTVQYRIERPKFYRLVQLLNKGYFKGIIVLCWDRASRNKGDNTVIEKLMKQGVDFRFTLASYANTSAGALHMDIDGMFAQHHSRVTSEKVSLTIKNQRSKGVCTYKAPVGYLNQGVMDNKPFDLVRAPLVKQLFEEYATGRYSLADLARWANAHGLTMPPVRRRRTDQEILAEDEDEQTLKIERVERPITYTNIHKILSSPFYTGRVLGVDNKYVVSTSHKPLVSDELFDKVQVLLGSKRVSQHYTQKLNYLYRGLLRCGICSRVYTPYIKKGILYFSSRCARECVNTQRNINLSFLEGSIDQLIQKLVFTDAEIAEMDAKTTADISLVDQEQKNEMELLDRKRRKISEDLGYLRENKLQLLRSGVYTPESLLTEEIRLTKVLSEIDVQEQTSAITLAETISDLKILSELLKSLYFYYKNANPKEKEEYARMLFSELSFSENTLRIKCKNGLQVLESRFYFVGDPTTWISEGRHNYYLLEESIHALRDIMGARPPPEN